jgi:hypothetical protein
MFYYLIKNTAHKLKLVTYVLLFEKYLVGLNILNKNLTKPTILCHMNQQFTEF